MTEDDKKEEYLTKAQEAEGMAEKAKGPLIRESWRKIAQNCRRLAGLADGD